MFKLFCDLSSGTCRENKTQDIVERMLVITANRVHLKRYPIDNPVTIFNPSIILEDSDVVVYARIVLGYFTYASAVAEIYIPYRDVYSNTFTGHYTAEIKVFPNNKFDIWGVEDPRVYKIDDKVCMTYCGRTVGYFDPSIRTERTLPITAVRENGEWKKISVYRLPPELRGFVISDKDAFLVKSNGKLYLFHRLHMRDENFYTVISEVPMESLEADGLKEVIVKNTSLALHNEEFEEKIGWSTPPVDVGGEYVVLLHGIDKETKVYRVFGILMNKKLEIIAYTPHYIMEPKEPYEIFGDRPFTIFPCGAVLIDDSILISYGAGDSAIGIGRIELSELMEIFDKSRIT